MYIYMCSVSMETISRLLDFLLEFYVRIVSNVFVFRLSNHAFTGMHATARRHSLLVSMSRTRSNSNNRLLNNGPRWWQSSKNMRLLVSSNVRTQYMSPPSECGWLGRLLCGAIKSQLNRWRSQRNVKSHLIAIWMAHLCRERWRRKEEQKT